MLHRARSDPHWVRVFELACSGRCFDTRRVDRQVRREVLTEHLEIRSTARLVVLDGCSRWPAERIELRAEDQCTVAVEQARAEGPSVAHLSYRGAEIRRDRLRDHVRLLGCNSALFDRKGGQVARGVDVCQPLYAT